MAKIISPRVGTPGDEYDETQAAADGINVDALIEHGFISAPKSRKTAKTESDTTQEQ